MTFYLHGAACSGDQSIERHSGRKLRRVAPDRGFGGWGCPGPLALTGGWGPITGALCRTQSTRPARVFDRDQTSASPHRGSPPPRFDPKNIQRSSPEPLVASAAKSLMHSTPAAEWPTATNIWPKRTRNTPSNLVTHEGLFWMLRRLLSDKFLRRFRRSSLMSTKPRIRVIETSL